MVKRQNLTDITDSDYDKRQDEFMQCQECGNAWGGTRDDYFMMPDDVVFECSECGSQDIALVRKIITIIKV